MGLNPPFVLKFPCRFDNIRILSGKMNWHYTYDGFHRRVLRTIRVWQPSNQWTDLDSTRFFYDGWNVIEEHTITAGTQTLARTFTWGSDLSGTPQGVGGVGGLLLAEEVSGGNTTARHYHYDGNGNVTEITDLAGAKVASYRYDAYGNTLAATGPYSAQNRYRFSTKPLDGEVTGAPLYYYGYRYYDPITGSWPSRDPIGERRGVNLYGFLRNWSVNRIDRLGNSPSWALTGPQDWWIHNTQPDGPGIGDHINNDPNVTSAKADFERWLHSDFRDVAINYLHKMYTRMIEIGELNEP